ncbi:MAG: efflux RND transporter periplasmic adaptor subunit [Magnetococcales bacterium]|nr:efflux RND transporter periplasmic adaptor subunit [Magnetococcales bacterium]
MNISILVFLCTLLATTTVRGDEPLQVTTKPLEAVLIHPKEEAPAETRSLNDGLITAQVTATIVAFSVQVGDRVKSGELVVRLDPWAYRLAERRAGAELEGLRARLEATRKRSQRSQQLQQQKQASDEKVEQLDSEVKELTAQIRAVEATLEEARIQAEKCQVRAPFDGVIVQRPARIGVNATPGTPLAQLVDTQAVELSATIPANRVESLTRATGHEFTHDGRSDPVQLRVIVPIVDPATRAQEARMIFTGDKPVPGTVGRVIWSDPQPHLPPWLLTRRDNTLGVFLVREEKAFFHPLPDALEGHPARLDPLPEGAVVISGRESLAHQAPVKSSPAP